jgi:Zn-dependent protease
MDSKVLIDGLISYLGLVVLFTFHEFGHAWMAWKCGDPTGKNEGRCSLNPLVHLDPIGSVLMPLMMLFLPSGAGRYLLGWAKPVPVNPGNLRNPKIDDILVTLAGPWMNLLLAVALIGLARVGLAAHSANMENFCLETAQLSLLLFFFNLLPIPPLDGSHILRVVVGMTYETYWQIARFGFIMIIVVMQIPVVNQLLGHATNSAMLIIRSWFGV